jgi:hypothetical protein
MLAQVQKVDRGNTTGWDHFLSPPSLEQGCQMVYFQNKNTNLGLYWRAFEWKMLVYFNAIWNI